ncbi:MAG: peptide chain release factor H [Paracoccaceae bacterium]
MTTTHTVSLLVTAGAGPEECNQAVGYALQRMEQEAEEQGVSLNMDRIAGPRGPKSAIVTVHGPTAPTFADAWTGTILWRAQSQLRRGHKRANWFIGVFRLPNVPGGDQAIRTRDVTFSTLRAGGPGGQHQNTTDSAVRAVHQPSGLSVVVRDGRSQHRNKALALERLNTLMAVRTLAEAEQQKASQNRLHHALERGNPIRRFAGPKFVEMT